MIRGIVFDIKELALFDGPGVRTTVFLKGCPLRCAWCHNPEGLSPAPQVLHGAAGPRLAGQTWCADDLAARLRGQADALREAEGGVTFSGGEPLQQTAFVAAVIARLQGMHTVLDTSGYGSSRDFACLLGLVDLVLFDLKLMDGALHRRWTGADNAPVLANLEQLRASGRPCIIRVPLVPGVTDGVENLRRIALACRCLPGLRRVELLPYNRAAGGKYRACGMAYAPPWDEGVAPRCDVGPFAELGLPVAVV